MISTTEARQCFTVDDKNAGVGGALPSEGQSRLVRATLLLLTPMLSLRNLIWIVETY
jgi:hypothetical protein